MSDENKTKPNDKKKYWFSYKYVFPFGSFDESVHFIGIECELHESLCRGPIYYFYFHETNKIPETFLVLLKLQRDGRYSGIKKKSVYMIEIIKKKNTEAPSQIFISMNMLTAFFMQYISFAVWCWKMISNAKASDNFSSHIIWILFSSYSFFCIYFVSWILLFDTSDTFSLGVYFTKVDGSRNVIVQWVRKNIFLLYFLLCFIGMLLSGKLLVCF